MKATVLAERSISYCIFHQVLSAMLMSTDVSQVGVALFPSFNIFYQVLGGKRPLGRPRHSWEDNIRMDLEEISISTRN